MSDKARNEPDQERPSKSQLKRDARELLLLCRELIGLSKGDFESLPLERDLERELIFAREIRANVAKKRQLQYVAKMMRNRDISHIIEAREGQKNAARQLTARQHRVEAWRDHLIAGNDGTLADFLSSYATGEAQTLRQLLRNARTEKAKEKPPAAARKLFRLLRDMDNEQALPNPPVI